MEDDLEDTHDLNAKMVQLPYLVVSISMQKFDLSCSAHISCHQYCYLLAN